jgi:hypothetical protein
MTKRTILVLLVASLALAVPATSSASDTMLVKTLVRWSQRIDVDSKKQRAVSSNKRSSLAEVKAATRRVLNDAVGARKALTREPTSTGKGARVRTLSIKAFTLFEKGERELLASLDAAAVGDVAGASGHAGNALKIVGKAAQILLRAGTLADQL